MRKPLKFPVFSLFLMLWVAFFGAPLLAQETLKDQLRNYDREDIHSIQKKLYNKQGRHEITLAMGGIMNHDGYFLTTGHYQYHLMEVFGIEAATGGFGFQSKDKNKIVFYQAGLTFSPLYGKVSLFTYAVMNYDIYLVGGAGVVRTSGLRTDTSFMGNFGVGYRFFINDYLSTRLEFRDYMYRLTYRNSLGAQTSRIWNNFALTLGISVLLPFRPAY